MDTKNKKQQKSRKVTESEPEQNATNTEASQKEAEKHGEHMNHSDIALGIMPVHAQYF